MAKFEFKLEALLRLRELEEDRAKRRFFDLLGARRRKEQEMHDVIREREDAKVRLRGGDGAGGVDATRLVAERRRLAALLEEAAARRELLDLFLFDKALYEIAYELSNRPAWVSIPVAGVLELLGENNAARP